MWVLDNLSTGSLENLGTFHVFEAARLANVRRGVVYASPAAVYGDLPRLPKEKQTPANQNTIRSGQTYQ